MAELPDGFVFIPTLKGMTTITLEQRQLVKCKKCRHYVMDGYENVIVYRCELGHEDMNDDFWCADGERVSVDAAD